LVASGEGRLSEVVSGRGLYPENLAPHALPGGYPNMLDREDYERTVHAYGANTARLQAEASLRSRRRFHIGHIVATSKGCLGILTLFWIDHLLAYEGPPQALDIGRNHDERDFDRK
jgi:hypothetical protein